MKFQYKVWRTSGANPEGALRVRLADGAVLGVELNKAREEYLEALFERWAAWDQSEGREVFRQSPPKPMPRVPRP